MTLSRFSTGFLDPVLQPGDGFSWKLLDLHVSLPQTANEISIWVDTRG